MKGRRIRTLSALAIARDKKQAVSIITISHPVPAAFAMNMAGSALHYLMRTGGMHIYKKPK